MGTPLEIVKELYAKLTAGDAGGALALMSEDIEWITMMDYKVDGRGPQNLAILLQMLTAEAVKGFGCRPRLMMCGLFCWPASESLQGRKPRGKDWCGTTCAMGI
jgi:hypothetical protein